MLFQLNVALFVPFNFQVTIMPGKVPLVQKASAKRSQLKMTETLFIMIIFFFLLIFGMVVYVKFNTAHLEKEARKLKQLKAIEILQNIQYLPELQCTDAASLKFDCLDYYKLISFSDVVKANRGYYDKLFLDSDAEVKVIYGSNLSRTTIRLYKSELQTKKKRATVFRMPIVVFDPVVSQYSFAYLNITVYS